MKNALKEWRVLRGYSQAELAQKIGVNRATLHRWEMGLSKPFPKHLKALSTALKVDTKIIKENLDGQD
jgi:transcriptional regulator with XRE-family HTH domain